MNTVQSILRCKVTVLDPHCLLSINTDDRLCDVLHRCPQLPTAFNHRHNGHWGPQQGNATTDHVQFAICWCLAQYNVCRCYQGTDCCRPRLAKVIKFMMIHLLSLWQQSFGKLSGNETLVSQNICYLMKHQQFIVADIHSHIFSFYKRRLVIIPCDGLLKELSQAAAWYIVHTTGQDLASQLNRNSLSSLYETQAWCTTQHFHQKSQRRFVVRWEQKPLAWQVMR